MQLINKLCRCYAFVDKFIDINKLTSLHYASGVSLQIIIRYFFDVGIYIVWFSVGFNALLNYLEKYKFTSFGILCKFPIKQFYPEQHYSSNKYLLTKLCGCLTKFCGFLICKTKTLKYSQQF